MHLRSFTLPVFALLTVATVNSCQKRHVDSGVAASGLQSYKNYQAKSVTYDKPARMFTAAGEVTDAAAIAAYQALHPWLQDTSLAAVTTPNIFTSQSELVYYLGWIPYKAKVQPNDVVIMRQQDTSESGHSNPRGSIELIYNIERQALALRDQILDMRESMTKVERLSDSSYRIRECFHVQGTFKENTIRLPYTYMSYRLINNCYPFALKPGVVPAVPAGDTLLVREGHVDLK